MTTASAALSILPPAAFAALMVSWYITNQQKPSPIKIEVTRKRNSEVDNVEKNDQTKRRLSM